MNYIKTLLKKLKWSLIGKTIHEAVSAARSPQFIEHIPAVLQPGVKEDIDLPISSHRAHVLYINLPALRKSDILAIAIRIKPSPDPDTKLSNFIIFTPDTIIPLWQVDIPPCAGASINLNLSAGIPVKINLYLWELSS